jgi:hypothetical protein
MTIISLIVKVNIATFFPSSTNFLYRVLDGSCGQSMCECLIKQKTMAQPSIWSANHLGVLYLTNHNLINLVVSKIQYR